MLGISCYSSLSVFVYMWWVNYSEFRFYCAMLSYNWTSGLYVIN